MSGADDLLSLTAGDCAPCQAAAAASEARGRATRAADTARWAASGTTTTLEDAPATAPWEGIIGLEGTATGDGRLIQPNALRWEPPLPLRYVSADVGAHDGAMTVGRIDQIERRPQGRIWGSGVFDLGSDVGREAYRQVSEGLTTGVSMDLDDVTFEVRIAQELLDEAMGGEIDLTSLTPGDDGTVVVATVGPSDELRVTTDGRIRAATVVAIPAFADAQITAGRVSLTAGGPAQARAPRGSRIGGRWIDTPGGILADAQSFGGTAGPPLSPGVAADFAAAECSATKYLTTNPDGSVSFNAERTALHDQMIGERLGGLTPREGEPVFNMMGGGPAAGKSVFARNNPEQFENAALINSDDFKMGEAGTGLVQNTDIPAGKPPAGWVHEESSYLAKQATNRAYDGGLSMTLDGTGDNSAASTRAKIKAARDHGYSVNAYYVTCPTDVAVERALAREAKTGRGVGETIIRQTHDRVSQVFPRVVNEMDTAALFDTDTNILIGEKKLGGVFTIYDKGGWDRFLAKASEFDGDSELDPIPDFPVQERGL